MRSLAEAGDAIKDGTTVPLYYENRIPELQLVNEDFEGYYSEYAAGHFAAQVWVNNAWVAALCIALKANPGNGLVKFFVDTADKLDFGVFSRGKDGVAHFKGHTHAAQTKNALINWGLAAVVWLIGGRIVERIVRP